MRKSAVRKGQYAYYLFLIPGFLLFIPIIIIPFVMNIIFSLTDWSGVGSMHFIGLANYLNAFKDEVFWISFKNNMLIVVAITTFPMTIAMILSVVLYDISSRKTGKYLAGFFRAGYYLPQIIAISASAIAWLWIYQPNWGAANWLLKLLHVEPVNWLGDPKTAMFSILIMMVWFQIGYPLVIFMSALQRIDPQLYEAAMLDGAGWWRNIFFITIPQIMGEISVVFLTTMIFALKVFAPVYAMTRTGGPGHSTHVAGYFAFKNFFERADVGYGSAIAMILSTIVIAITIVFINVQSKLEN
jgi:raffinose/stachyose/melibiose transport system permease protein